MLNLCDATAATIAPSDLTADDYWYRMGNLDCLPERVTRCVDCCCAVFAGGCIVVLLVVACVSAGVYSVVVVCVDCVLLCVSLGTDDL